MVKRILLALIALCWANAAFAQSFPKPPDVPAYEAVTPLYKTDGTTNVVLDSTVTPMPVGSGLANIPIPSTTNRIKTNGPFDGSTDPFITTIPYGGTGHENKFRTIIDFSHMLPDDPVRNFGQPGTSHLHCFFGAGSANAYSTYKTLRQHALDSVAAGTDANGTAYWFPCIVVLNPYGDGKNYAIRLDHATVYYTENPATGGTGDGAKAHIPIGTRYVLLFDMDASSPTTQYAWLQSVLDAANAAQGHTRYVIRNGGGFPHARYNCTGATPTAVDYIKNADGSDPFGGTCGSGQDFYISATAPPCYDGKNLWSPGGYKHIIPEVWDSDKSNYVCPYNYYRLPQLTIQLHYTQYGWTDRQRWDLSSDISYRAAHGLTQTTFPPGSSFHTDWMDGWDNVQRRKWEDNCSGVEHAIGHECDTSQISATEALKGGSSSETGVSRSPQVDLSSIAHVLQTDPGWMLIPPAWSGSLTNMHIHN